MPLTQEILTAAAKALREFEFTLPETADTWLKTEFEKTTAGNRNLLKDALEKLKHKDDSDAVKKTAAVASVMALFAELDKELTVGKNTAEALAELDSKASTLMGAAKMEYTNASELVIAIQKGRFSTLVLKAPIPGGISHEDIRKAEKAASYLGLDKEIFRECFDLNCVDAVAKINDVSAVKFPLPRSAVDDARVEAAIKAVLKLVEAVFDAREAIEGTKSDAPHATKSSAKEQPTFVKNINAEVAKDPKYKEILRKKHENTLQVLENIHKGLEWEAALPDPHKGMELELKGGRKKFFSEEFKEMKTECENKYKAAGWKVVAGDSKATADMGKNFSIKTADEKSVLVDGSTEDHVKVSKSACEASGIKSEKEVDEKMIELAVEGAKLKGLTEVAINSCPKELEKKLIEELGKVGIKAITDEQLTKKVKASELFNPPKGKGAKPGDLAAKKSWYDIRPSPWK